MMTPVLVSTQVFFDLTHIAGEPTAGIRKAHGFFCLKGGDEGLILYPD
jgi:hypothetical protein